MSDTAIRVSDLGKMYRIGAIQKQAHSLRETLRQAALSPFAYLRTALSPPSDDEILWALQDINFEIKKGEVVGIIGRNGAGKSTLLKILSRITEPTTGSIDIYGRVGSLLEVGTGFHPELTGRENIYLNGAILGMRKAEIDRNFDEIIDFSGVERFIDTPVKRYSSGMYVRLAFSVAAHLETEILLVDEVLAVGDIAFQNKCLGKMGDVASAGRTVLFVSHNMATIESLCDRSLLLADGRVTVDDETPHTVKYYIEQVTIKSQQLEKWEDRSGDRKLEFTDLRFETKSKQAGNIVQSGESLDILLSYQLNQDVVRNISLAVGIYTLTGQVLVVLGNEMVGKSFESITSSGFFRCTIDHLPLTPGQYSINIYCESNGVITDWIRGAALLTVEAGDYFGTGRLPPKTHGGLLVQHEWNLSNN